jgi:gas vesicle protein
VQVKFRHGLIVGLAAGYVLGAKAGRQRYDQIRKVTETVASVPPVRQLIDETKELADAGTTKAREIVSDQLQSVSEHVRDIAREKLG